jgi:hypothetical protein
MIESHSTFITYQGQPAELSVIRNDGVCWGRLVTAQGAKYDVECPVDQYEEDDSDALDAFSEALDDPTNVSDAAGWL